MKRLTLVWIVIAALTACQPAGPLPTVISLEAVGTENALTATANAPTPTATRRALPPTFTPTATETPAIEPTATITLTPEGFSGAGTIYYLYNGDSIAVVNGDGTGGGIFITYGVGIPINDLTLSPDGLLLAYVAPGAGSGREVYISSRDGSYTQKVTCLGMTDIRYVTWAPDSQQLAFYAAPAPGAPGNIYIASYIGANTCPSGNNQRILIPMQSSDIRGMAFNRAGTILYYAGGGPDIYAWELATGNRALMTYSSGFGGDFALAHSPTLDTLAYLRYVRLADGREGGALVQLNNTGFMPKEPRGRGGSFMDGKTLHWSQNGEILLITTETLVYIFNFANSEVTTINDAILVAPDAAARPDAREIAYTTVDGHSVEQIFVYNRETRQVRQLTANPEGTITNLVWAGDVLPE